MLKRKNLIILAAALAVLIVTSLAQRLSHDKSTSRSSSIVMVAGEFSRDTIGRIVIGRGAQTEAVVLTAAPAGWQVTTAWNAPASTQRVDGLLQALSNLRGEFRSDSKAILADYGFTDSSTVRITGYDPSGAPVFTVEAGEKPRQGTGSFVRRPGAPEVYLVAADLLGAMGAFTAAAGPQSRHFLDLQAFKCEREGVDSITLHDAGSSLALTKTFEVIQPAPGDTTHTAPYTDRASWEWRVDPRRPVAKTKVDAVLATVTNLRAQDVADPGSPAALYGLDAPTRRAVIKMADGTTATLSFGGARTGSPRQPAGVYCRVEGRPMVWVVAEYQVESIFKKADDLKPDA
jgi:hypothetical protein